MFGKCVPALFAGVVLVSLGGCAVGQIKTVPAAESSLSASQRSLREQAAVIAETSWKQVKDQGSSLASFASVLMHGRDGEEGAAPAPAELYLAEISATASGDDAVLAVMIDDVLGKAEQVDRFIQFASLLADTKGAAAAAPEDCHIVELASAQLKRQKAIFEAAGRHYAARHRAADTAPLAHALGTLQGRIEALDAVAQRLQAASA